MRPSEALEKNRAFIRDAAKRYGATNPRLFGSVLHGTDKEGSDVDLLVDALPGTTLFELGGLQVELESVLGVSVQIVVPEELHRFYRDRVLTEAEPV